MRFDSLWFLVALPAISTASSFGATTYACIHMQTEPSDAFTVDWKVGATGDQCMDHKGSDGSMKVTDQGLNCHEVGWVDIDDGWGHCHWYESWWSLSYTTKGAAYSGSTRSQWSFWGSGRTVEISSYSPGTQICGSKALCSSTKVEFKDDGAKLYFIFLPYKVSLSEANSTESVDYEL